jgi:hypothetical protein|tara:strand:+ start:3309 stop:3836 length:528 start_codon:yes stop_codon:yes gene_type:complete
MLLQEHYARQACKEIELNNPKIEIDHLKGETIIDNKTYGIVFPKSLIEYCKGLWSERTNEFYFKGVINGKREWIKQYSNVYESDRGRNTKLKYSLDKEYYTSLAETKFALSPTGGCDWSYRMFESIACGAIPILGDNDIDIFIKDYKYFRHSDQKKYNIEDANNNYKILLKNITI